MAFLVSDPETSSWYKDNILGLGWPGVCWFPVPCHLCCQYAGWWRDQIRATHSGPTRVLEWEAGTVLVGSRGAQNGRGTQSWVKLSSDTLGYLSSKW